MATSAPVQQSATQINAQNRAIVLSNSVNMIQQVNTQTVFPASQPQITFTPNFVGLIKRFYIEVSGVISNSGTQPINLTQWGLANVISNLIYTDPNNNQRHNTNGLHLTAVSMAKRQRPMGAAFSIAQQMITPATWGVFSAPATIAASSTGNFRAVFEVPLAYSNHDLRGAVYSNLVNATQNLQITVNPNAVAAGTADPTFAIYSGAAGSAGSITSATITVSQEYLDQLPRGNGGTPILPGIDLSTIYQLKYSPQAGISANQNFNVSYANFNSFVSTLAIYNSTGSAAGLTVGTDVNFWQLTSANLTAFWKMGPQMCAQMSRERLLCDLPAGAYYFDSRSAPILTNQYGNVQLTLNPSVGGPNATLLTFWEYFASLSVATSGGSLASS